MNENSRYSQVCTRISVFEIISEANQSFGLAAIEIR